MNSGRHDTTGQGFRHPDAENSTYTRALFRETSRASGKGEGLRSEYWSWVVECLRKDKQDRLQLTSKKAK
jgi:hypothetical protein